MALSNHTTTPEFAKTISYDRIEHEYRAELDGRLIGYYPSYLAAETALNQVAYDLLMDEQVVTADIEAEAASTEAPLLVEPVTSRAYWCGVDGCSYEPRHMHGDTPLCCGHYGEAGRTCDCEDPPTPDPSPSGEPWPTETSYFVDASPAEVARFSVTLRDHNERSKMVLCGRPIVAPALLDEADQVLRAEGCGWCGGKHHIQLCPSIWSLLRAPDAERVSLELIDRMAGAA